MSEDSLVLGIDGGGTSTTCVLANARGQTLARVEAPASNHRKTNLRETRAALLAGIQDAAREAKLGSLENLRISAACAGLAGVDTPHDAAAISEMIRTIIAADALQVVNDGEIALVGALQDEPGVLIISGTGSIAWALAADGRRLRVGGWDYLLGDEGSAYQIGWRVLRAVAAAHDKRSAQTSLTESVFAALNVSNFDGLLEAVYHQAMTPQRIAKLAPLADKAAASGDEAAINMLRETAGELATLAASVARLAHLETKPFPIVASGGALLANGFFTSCFREAVCAAAPNLRFRAPVQTPVEGAVMLARRALRCSPPDLCSTLETIE